MYFINHIGAWSFGLHLSEAGKQERFSCDSSSWRATNLLVTDYKRST